MQTLQVSGSTRLATGHVLNGNLKEGSTKSIAGSSVKVNCSTNVVHGRVLKTTVVLREYVDTSRLFGCSLSRTLGSSQKRPNRSIAISSKSQVVDSAVEEKDSRGTDERRARLFAQRDENYELVELQRPLAEYMALPASQYSVLDAERIERIDENSFKCYAHRLKFFAFEICPVLTVRVEERPNGCCIRLLNCTLEGSPIVEAQNRKFSASMENNVSWRPSLQSPSQRQLVSNTSIEVSLVIPSTFFFLSVDAIEATGNQVLSQLLRLMLPRFLQQLGKDYKAWASGDESRQALGTGEL